MQGLPKAIYDIQDEEVPLILPERNSLKRQVNRIRNRHRPPDPTSLHGIEIPEEYKVIRCGEPFLIHDSGAQGDKRILIYTTYDNIQYLSDSIP